MTTVSEINELSGVFHYAHPSESTLIRIPYILFLLLQQMLKSPPALPSPASPIFA